jgi:hypothetical protein
MPALIRLELFDDVKANGGSRRALVKNWLACEESVDIDGTDTMTLTLHGENEALVTSDTPVGEMNADMARVLRAVYADGSAVERRIETVNRDVDQGDDRVTVTALGMLHELGLCGKVYRQRPGGKRTYHFQAASQTAEQHLVNYILPAIWEGKAPYWRAAVLDTASEPVTVVYDMDSPLSALRKLVNAHLGYVELMIDYASASKRYQINLVQQQGVDAPIVRVRAGPALMRMGVSRTVRDTVNRVYGFGGTDPEVGRAHMGQNLWQVLGLRFEGTALWIGVRDPAGGPGPIAYDGQFTGDAAGRHRLVSADPLDAQWYIIGSSQARQEFQVQLIQGGQNGSWLQIAAPMDELTYVERSPAPSGRNLKVRVGHIELPEVAGTVNVIANPVGRWNSVPVTALPADWTITGTPAIANEANPIYVRHGSRSIRVSFTDLGQRVTIRGINNGNMPNGRVSYYADAMVLSGQIRVGATVFLTTNKALPDGSLPVNFRVRYPEQFVTMHPGDDIPTTDRSTTLNQWERLGVEAIHNATAYPVQGVDIEIRPLAVPSVVIIDGAQATNTATWRDLVEGGGGNALLQAANARLTEMCDYAEEVSVQTLDLSTVDDVQFPFRDYVLGGGIMVDLPELDVAIRTRIIGWDRDWLDPANLKLKIATSGPDVLRVLASRLPTPEAGG